MVMLCGGDRSYGGRRGQLGPLRLLLRAVVDGAAFLRRRLPALHKEELVAELLRGQRGVTSRGGRLAPQPAFLHPRARQVQVGTLFLLVSYRR